MTTTPEIKPQLRDDAMMDMAHAVRNAVNAVAAKSALTKSCMNCTLFREDSELCMRFAQRPPARVIAYGCSEHEDVNEIPF